MSILLDEVIAQAADGSPETVTFSSEDVAVLMFASSFLDRRENWLDRREDPLDEVTDADWDEIEKLVGNLYEAIMHPLVVVGAITMYGAETPPDGWLLCDGTAVSRATYAELFAVVGETWGAGNGTTTFNLPDFRYRSPMGLSTVPSLVIGEAAGEAAHALTQTENAGHSHTVNDPGHAHTITRYNGTAGSGVARSVWQNNANPISPSPSVDTNTTGITLENSGDGVPHNTVHPVRGVPFIIYAGV